MRSSSHPAWLLLPAVILLLHAGLGYAHRPLIDDAFISLRYSDNLLRGGGLVFNPGERVEGYSNLLWVLLLAPFPKIGISLPDAARWIGLACALWTLVATSRLARSLGLPDRHGLAASGLLTLLPAFAFWSVRGLETPLYTLLLTVGLGRLVLESQDSSRRSMSWIAFALLSITRPEGILFSMVGLGTLILVRRRCGLRELTWLTAALSLPLLQLVGRRLYYQDWLPTTFYHRQLWPWTLQRPIWQASLGTLGSFGAENPGLVLLLILGLIGLLKRPRNAPRGMKILGAVILVQLAFILALGFDWMSHHRFLVPLLPLLAILIAAGVPELLGGRAAGRRRWIGPPFLALAALGLLGAGARTSWNVPTLDRSWQSGNVTAYTGKRRALSEWLSRFEGPLTLAYDDVGLYFFDLPLRSHDFGGLVHPLPGRLAREWPDQPERVCRAVADDLFIAAPHVVMLRTNPVHGAFPSTRAGSTERFTVPIRAWIHGDPRLEKDYIFWGRLRENDPPLSPGTGPGSTFLVYGRRDQARLQPPVSVVAPP